MTSDDRTTANRPPDAVPGDDAQPSNQPIEEQVRTVPLDEADAPDQVLAQENSGPGNMVGGGEWPDPDAPARGPAPGTARGGAEAIAEQRDTDRPAAFKDALEDDRVAGGSSSVPDDV